MTTFRSCYDSLRSFLNRRRRITAHDSDHDRSDVIRKQNNISVHSDEIEHELARRILCGTVDDRTRSCCCESDSGDEHARKIGSNVDHDDGINLRDICLNNDPDSETVHYFNHASQAPLSSEVQKLGIDLLQSSPWNNADNSHSALYSQARIRSLFAALIDGDETTIGGGAMQDEDTPTAKNNSGSRIAMFPSTAFAITLAARNIVAQRDQREYCGAGGRILVLQDQFDSAVYPWQQVCDESGGRLSLDIVGHPNGADHNGGNVSVSDKRHASGSNNKTNIDSSDVSVDGWTRAVLEKLQNDHNSNEIVAACLPPLHWSDGTILDLETIGAVCKDRSIPLIVDATQGMCSRECEKHPKYEWACDASTAGNTMNLHW